MLINSIPNDKKKYTDKLTEVGLKFNTKPNTKKVTVEVDISEEDLSNFITFMSVEDENL